MLLRYVLPCVCVRFAYCRLDKVDAARKYLPLRVEGVSELLRPRGIFIDLSILGLVAPQTRDQRSAGPLISIALM
jgi:hypothetical protein